MMQRKLLKISIGMKLRTGSWGGSNQFGTSLVKYLEQQGVEVFFDLKEPDLDLILLTDPRKQGVPTFRHQQIISYLLRNNWKTLVVHRINECDERKGTTDVNTQLMEANFCVDHTVFISHWLRKLFLGHGLKVASTSSVLFNGADQNIFHSHGCKRWNHQEKLRLITHHWGGNWMKGFDIYERMDRLLADPSFQKKFDLTYIGNVPEGFQFQHVTHLSGQSGTELADSLRRHHVYLTASQNEPAGMHHVEGGLCGLPLLYRKSGALPDYCSGFGIEFTPENFEQKLWEMRETYDTWAERMKMYPNTAEQMCQQYYSLFLSLLEQRRKLLRQRTFKLKRPVWVAKGVWRRVRKTLKKFRSKKGG